MNIQYYKPSDIIMAEYNPRQLTKDQYAQLKDSLSRFGLVDPLIINKHKERKNILVGGHQRLRVATDLGINKIPCVEVNLPLDKEKELNIRLNKNVGEWDYDSLANYFDVGELTEWGFSNDELQFYEDEPEQGLIDDDEIPEVEEAVTKLGDLWLLGEHRVLCGDATKKEDVERLMDNQKADMVFTDPPYLMDFDGGMTTNKKGNWKKSYNSKHGAIKNDKIEKSKEFDFLNSFNQNIKDFTIGSFYICFYRLKLGQFFKSLKDVGIKVRTLITWDKGNHTMSNSDYWSKCEHIFYGWIDEHNFYGKSDYDIWNIPRTKKNNLHPTMKPVDLITKAINNSSLKDNIVLDPFLGSGSTLIAAEKTNRKCYGMELDPNYCDVIVKRWEEFTGKKAERIKRIEG